MLRIFEHLFCYQSCSDDFNHGGCRVKCAFDIVASVSQICLVAQPRNIDALLQSYQAGRAGFVQQSTEISFSASSTPCVSVSFLSFHSKDILLVAICSITKD